MNQVKQTTGDTCQVSEENVLNTTKGIEYIQNYYVEDLPDGVNEQCRVMELVEAKWIKPRRTRDLHRCL